MVELFGSPLAMQCKEKFCRVTATSGGSEKTNSGMTASYRHTAHTAHVDTTPPSAPAHCLFSFAVASRQNANLQNVSPMIYRLGDHVIEINYINTHIR